MKYILKKDSLNCEGFQNSPLCDNLGDCSNDLCCYYLKAHQVKLITDNNTTWAVQNLQSNININKRIAKHIIENNK